MVVGIRLAVLVLISAGWLAIACSDNGEAPTPTPPTETPAVDAPLPVPGITFGSSLGPGGRLTGGTHCWEGRCVDMAGPVTATEPFVIPTGVELQLLVEGLQPTELLHRWVAVPGDFDRELIEGQFVWMNVDNGAQLSSGTAVTPSETGEFLLLVFARWDGQGDYSFAGYFDVR